MTIRRGRAEKDQGHEVADTGADLNHVIDIEKLHTTEAATIVEAGHARGHVTITTSTIDINLRDHVIGVTSDATDRGQGRGQRRDDSCLAWVTRDCCRCCVRRTGEAPTVPRRHRKKKTSQKYNR